MSSTRSSQEGWKLKMGRVARCTRHLISHRLRSMSNFCKLNASMDAKLCHVRKGSVQKSVEGPSRANYEAEQFPTSPQMQTLCKNPYADQTQIFNRKRINSETDRLLLCSPYLSSCLLLPRSSHDATLHSLIFFGNLMTRLRDSSESFFCVRFSFPTL